MPSDPFQFSFHSSDNPGPDNDKHWMHLAYASNWAIGFLALYGIILLVLIAGTVWQILPDVVQKSPTTDTNLWERELLLLVVCFGALGGLVHMFTSLGTFVGGRQLLRSWLLFYVLRPVIGGIIAVIVYFILRLGVLSPGQVNVSEQINIYGILTFSALSGMFSRQAVDKLAEIFNTLFRKVQEDTEQATSRQLLAVQARSDLAARLSPSEVPSGTFGQEEEVKERE